MIEPVVSVIIPTYNSARTIVQAIEGVFNQTYGGCEIIVVDDGSTDNTRTVLDRYVQEKRIRYIYQENRGCGAARNIAIERAKGKYLAFLDADDYWHPKKIETQIEILENRTECILCYTDTFLVDGEGNQKIPRHSYMNQPRSGKILPFLLFNNMLTLSSVVVRKEIFIAYGMFTEEKNLMMFADYDAWLKLAPHGKFFAIKKQFVFYRTRLPSSRKVIQSNFQEIVTIFRNRMKEASKTVKVLYCIGFCFYKVKLALYRVIV